MAKILICPDSPNWAIDQLAQKRIKFNPHHIFKCKYVHPRDAGVKKIQDEFMAYVNKFDPDIIHFEYFRSAAQLLEALPELQKRKIILTHHNQRKDKALLYADWNALGIDQLVTHTEKCAEILKIDGKQKNIQIIKHGIDLEFFTYCEDEPEEFTVGYSGRIVPWKRLDMVVSICRELNVPLMFMGRQDKMDYWNKIPDVDRNHINYSFMDCKDDDRVDFFRNITVYVNISDDGYEEGPLGFFEAGACGVPIITTPNGSAVDLGQDKENCLMIPFGNKEFLKRAIIELRDNKSKRKDLRNRMWQTIKNYSDRRMAYNYSKLYYKMVSDKPLVSVILPTYNRLEQINEILEALKNQTYENFEIIIADDGSEEDVIGLVHKWRDFNPSLPIKYIKTDSDVKRESEGHAYGLAKARNMAVCEAEGEFLIFIDSRLKPESDVIERFVDELDKNGDKRWYFGNKGTDKKTFVENFSAISKYHFVKFGMMNERIERYGGLSQEIRERWQAQKGIFIYLEDVKCVQIKSASKGQQRREDIIKMKDLIYKLNN